MALSDFVPSFLLLHSLISPLFPSQCPCDKIFLHMTMSMNSVCMAMWFAQEIFVCVMYVPFHQLLSVGLSGSSGNFCAHNVRIMLNQQYWGSLRLVSIMYIYYKWTIKQDVGHVAKCTLHADGSIMLSRQEWI